MNMPQVENFEQFSDYVEAFIKACKGNKIKLPSWHSEKWFIPNGECVTYSGLYMLDGVDNTGKQAMFVLSDDLLERWIFAEDIPRDIPTKNGHKCTCSSYDLFNFGCRCGGN